MKSSTGAGKRGESYEVSLDGSMGMPSWFCMEGGEPCLEGFQNANMEDRGYIEDTEEVWLTVSYKEFSPQN